MIRNPDYSLATRAASANKCQGAYRLDFSELRGLLREMRARGTRGTDAQSGYNNDAVSFSLPGAFNG
jgi:hypothetical protein